MSENKPILLHDRYRLLPNQLGSGTFSNVYLAIDLNNSNKVAVKKIDMVKFEYAIDKIRNEIEIIRTLDHPNIIKCHDVFQDEHYTYLVMEYCDKGTLSNIVREHKNNIDSVDFDAESNARYYLAQLKDALEYLNAKAYVHRDIKPSNILLKSSEGEDTGDRYLLKLADFGLAKSNVHGDMDKMDTFCGSPLYMAPEIVFCGKYASNVDLWAVGVIMYQLLYGKNPYIFRNIDDLRKKICVDIMFPLTYGYSEDAMDLLKKLLEKNNERRINIQNFVEHAWFNLDRHTPDNSRPIEIPKYSTDFTSQICSPESPSNSLGTCNLSRMNYNSTTHPSSCPSRMSYRATSEKDGFVFIS